MYCKVLKKQLVKYKEALQSYHPDDTSMPMHRKIFQEKGKTSVEIDKSKNQSDMTKPSQVLILREALINTFIKEYMQ